MSIIRQIVESIAKRLADHDYFRTVPKIPVLVEDQKDVEKSILNAMQTAGAFVLINFDSADADSPDTPGPYLNNSSFKVTISEIPSLWRSRGNHQPSCTEIAEAVCRLIHHHQPLDAEGLALSGGVLLFDSMSQQANESMLQQVITFRIPIGLTNTDPER
jgi:hypothetical protein